MKSLIKVFVLAVLLVCSGCNTEQDRNYKTLAVTFFRKPLKEQIVEFSRFDIEKQYVVFICGNQYIHPPATYLAGPFAMEGEKIVGFLTEKLATANDETVRDIALVFTEMNRRDVYAVWKNKELMNLLKNRVAQIKDDEWRRIIEGQMMIDLVEKP